MKTLRQTLAFIFLSLLLTLSTLPEIKAQNIPDLNCYMIGSEKMPVRYIRGTGSNIGLFVGIEYDSNGKKGFPKHGPGMGANHGRGDGGYGPGPGGGGQGGGRPASPAFIQAQIARMNAQLESRHLKAKFEVSRLHSWLPRNYPSSLPKHLETGTDDFQLLPLTRFTINPNDGVQEVLLPILCQDIYLPVPDTAANYGFEKIDLRIAVPETYVGIYRFDQYIEDHIAPHAWVRDGWIAASSGLSDEEFNMLTYCEIFADSSITEVINGETFYAIEHAYMSASLANYPVWVPNENQSLSDCEIGIESIWMQNNGTDTLGLFAFKQAIFELNHYVFHFAELDSFKNRFPAPAFDAGMPSVPDLRPYSLIKFSPINADSQNEINGVEFLGQFSLDADGSNLSYSWNFGDGSSSTLEDPVHQYTQLGTYMVYLTVTDMAGNTGKDSVELTIGSVGIEDLLENFDLSIYPNPTSGVSTVTFSLEKKENVSIEVYNYLGQEIEKLIEDKAFYAGSHTVIWNPNQMDEIPGGVYFFKIKIGNIEGSEKILYYNPN